MRRAVIPSAFAVAAVLVACGGSSTTDLFGSSSGADAASDGAAQADGAVGDEGSTPGDLDGATPDPDGGTTGQDATTGGTCPSPAGNPAGDGGLTCNGVGLQGTPLMTNCHNGPAPVAMGGTLRDGLYVLEQLDYYGDPNSCPKESERIVWNVCGAKWASVQDSGLGAVYYNIDAVLGALPGQVTLNLKCPSQATVQDHYDAAKDSFTLYININGGVRLDRFKRQ